MSIFLTRLVLMMSVVVLLLPFSVYIIPFSSPRFPKYPPAYLKVCSIISIDEILIFVVPFIYNSLWACIEPPVFIMAGCLLTFGPLYQAHKSGARSLLRSLQSRLLKRSAKSSPLSQSPASSSRGNSKHAWRIISEPYQGDNATRRADWELKTADEVHPPRRSPAAMV